MNTLRDYSLCHRQSHGADCRSYIADIDSLHCVQLRWEASTSTIGRYPVGFRSLSHYCQLLTHIHIDKYNYELVSLVPMHAFWFTFIGDHSNSVGKQAVFVDTRLHEFSISEDVYIIVLPISRSQYA